MVQLKIAGSLPLEGLFPSARRTHADNNEPPSQPKSYAFWAARVTFGSFCGLSRGRQQQHHARLARFPEIEGGRAAPMTFRTSRFREGPSLHLSHVFSEEGQRRGRSRRGAPATEALCTTKYWTRGCYLSANNLDDWANLPRRNCPRRERPTAAGLFGNGYLFCSLGSAHCLK